VKRICASKPQAPSQALSALTLPWYAFSAASALRPRFQRRWVVESAAQTQTPGIIFDLRTARAPRALCPPSQKYFGVSAGMPYAVPAARLSKFLRIVIYGNCKPSKSRPVSTARTTRTSDLRASLFYPALIIPLILHLLKKM
jgi:hypothetical protein